MLSRLPFHTPTALAALAMLALAAAQSSLAQPAPPAGQPPAPPPEAYAACTGKAEGASVTLTLRDGRTVAGVCRTIAGRLAAAPADRPAPGPGGEPPPAR